MTHPPAFQQLLEQRILSVIRAPSPDAAIGAALAVHEGGVDLIEITYTVPDANRVMREVGKRAGITMGAGTVLSAAQARAAIDCGARFLVAPNFTPEVAAVAREAGVMFCPGAYTPTEIVAARAGGAHVVKVHPVGVAGGPAYIQVIRDPLPDIPMLAAGGTNLDNFIPFLRAGCVGVGLGPAIADPGLAAEGQYAEITRRARAFGEKLREARAVGQVAALA
jgi:2-dehydro-3-deoxyphosphogluconate aldolase/(4S)-4-hydroxy-2-oxoglutarate aldolase